MEDQETYYTEEEAKELAAQYSKELGRRFYPVKVGEKGWVVAIDVVGNPQRPPA